MSIETLASVVGAKREVNLTRFGAVDYRVKLLGVKTPCIINNK